MRQFAATLCSPALCMLQGPQIVTVPEFDTPKRYWIVPFLDAYLNYYGAIGSYFNSSAGQYLIVGRGKHRRSRAFLESRISHLFLMIMTSKRSLLLLPKQMSPFSWQKCLCNHF